MSATGRRGVCDRRGRRAGRIGILTMALATAWALVAAVAAGATTVTVGSVLPPTFKSTPFEGVRTQFNSRLPESGANLGSPVTGAIVRWKMQGAVGGPFTLRVLHPNGSGAYTPTGTSAPVTPSGTGIETFSAQLPIRSGDVIAVDSSNPTDQIGVAEVPGAAWGLFAQPPLEGTTLAASQTKADQEIELSAEVQPAPAITAVTPAEGSVFGGDEVTITGSNLEGVSAVTFGEVPAASFSAVSETEITAVAPPQVGVGSVDVTATTVAGVSPTVTADKFLYRGCRVPKLAGRKLGPAKAAIRGAGCSVGTVGKAKGPKGKKGKVFHQNPTAGRLLAPGAKVSFKLAK
jgi:hypothetical protein